MTTKATTTKATTTRKATKAAPKRRAAAIPTFDASAVDEHKCSGKCGAVLPVKKFPTPKGTPGGDVRLTECRGCRDDRYKAAKAAKARAAAKAAK